jgi:hypothetical protein
VPKGDECAIGPQLFLTGQCFIGPITVLVTWSLPPARSYVGAMPGRLVAGLRRAAAADPVMLLDELDKMGADPLRGAPSSALLEVGVWG